MVLGDQPCRIEWGGRGDKVPRRDEDKMLMGGVGDRLNIFWMEDSLDGGGGGGGCGGTTGL